MRHSKLDLRTRTGHGAQGKANTKIKGIVRRMRVVATSGFAWALDGFTDSYGKTETADAENFEGVGFASRPATADNVEVITVKVGGESGHAVIVGSRNRDALKALIEAEGLEADETVIFTGTSMVKIKADGTIEAGSIGGTRKRLATIDDIDELKALFVAWSPVGADGGAALKTIITAGFGGEGPWLPTGTTKVRAE